MNSTTESQEVFFDESGFTGANLLNIDQPFFSYAAVAFNETEAEAIVKGLRNKYSLQGRELKFAKIKKHSKAKFIIEDFLQAIQGRASFTCFDKKYSLCAKFFEYIFEPCISDVCGLFYAAGFHHFITYNLYNHFFKNNEHSNMLTDFEKLMSENKKTELAKSFVKDFEQSILPQSSLGLEDLLKVFITYNKKEIIDEFDFLSGDTATDKYIGDLSFTALFNLCAAMCHKFHSIKITYDKSKILQAQQETLEEIANHEFYIPNINPYLENKQERIFIDKNIESKESKSSYGIQLADMLAGITCDAFKMQDKNTILKLTNCSIHSLVVIPDINKGSIIELLEPMYIEILILLVKNSMQNKPLLDNNIELKLAKLREVINIFP